jgi:uncharacterized protein (DUF4415 family)
MNSTSETNWDMIDALTDETIDRTELPLLDDSFFARAKWRMPEKPVPVTIRIDSDLLAWFKAQGNEYEQRMLAALRIYAQAHKDITFESIKTA